jgi:hypothetical protein
MLYYLWKLAPPQKKKKKKKFKIEDSGLLLQILNLIGNLAPIPLCRRNGLEQMLNQGPVVQSWISANTGFKFNQLF